MLASRSFTRKPMPERQPMAWPGVQAFAASPRCDVGITITGQPKTEAVRSEAYRRLVAALPCIHCGIWHQSQAAHPPPKGKGIKEDDRECFPLCCTRPLITGCHVEFDQYRLIPTDQMRPQAARWGAITRARIIAAGQWPRRLPMYQETYENNISKG